LKPKAGSSPRKPRRLSEFAADGLLVGIEGPLDEEFVGLGIQVIHERVGAVLGAVWLLADRVGRSGTGSGQNDFPVARGHGPVHVPDELSKHLRGATVEVDSQYADGSSIELVGVLLAGGDGDALGKPRPACASRGARW